MGIVRELWWYRYYDTPEGEDCFHKMFYTTKWMFAAGCAWGWVETWANRHLVPGPTATGMFIRGLTVSAFPLAAVGATWGAVACMSSALRKKEDKWNYTLGGLAAGGVFGALLTHRFEQGALAAVLFGLAGYIKRGGMQAEHNFFGNPELIRKTRTNAPSLYWRDYGPDWRSINNFQPAATRYYFPSSVEPLPASFTGGLEYTPTQNPVYGTPSEPGKGLRLR